MFIEGVKSSMDFVSQTMSDSIAEVVPGGGGTDFSNILDKIKAGGDQPNSSSNSIPTRISTSPLSINSSSMNNNGSFASFIKEIVSDTNEMAIESSKKTDMFVKGEPIDIHDVMIASNKAKTSFQLLLELRNKGLDLYREVSRMQS
jgi:flagellar hook-basal body complex protein FliE